MNSSLKWFTDGPKVTADDHVQNQKITPLQNFSSDSITPVFVHDFQIKPFPPKTFIKFGMGRCFPS